MTSFVYIDMNGPIVTTAAQWFLHLVHQQKSEKRKEHEDNYIESDLEAC